MQRKTLLIAAVVVAVMLVLLFVMDRGQAPRRGSPSLGALFEDLKQQLPAIDRIKLRDASNEITLRRTDSGWTIQERDAYPANFTRLEALLGALSEARLLEAMTERPEHYHRLGLAGLEADNSDTIAVQLFSSDTLRYGLLVGNKASGRDGHYVRRADDPPSWLIDQSLDVTVEVKDWLVTELVDLEFDRIAEFVRRGATGGDFSASKTTPSSANFVTDAIPDGRSLRFDSALNSPARALSNASLEDVRALPNAAAVPENAVETTYRSFDGLQIKVWAWRDDDDKSWIRLLAAVDESVERQPAKETNELTSGPPSDEADGELDTSAAPDVNETDDRTAEVATINSRVNGWAFEVSSYTYGELSKGLQDYLAEPEQDEATAAQGSGILEDNK